jgi:SagB-type dehydrogenase family enzyme
MMLPAGDSRTLALLFHLNSEPWSVADAPADEVYEVEFKRMPGSEARLALPPAEGGLLDLIGSRTSCRAYAPETMALEDLAQLLAGSYGMGRSFSFAEGLEMRARVAPSAGGLYPLELYLLLARVDGVADGLYHYDVLDHVLECVRTELDPGELVRALIAAPLVRNANAIVFMTAVFDRTLRKYGPRGYRFILLEAGHVAQNLCLLATERGLASLCVGGFVDSRVNRMLEVEPQVEAAVYCVAVGHPAAE